MKKNYLYFVSYCFADDRGLLGFGQSTISWERKIKVSDDIVSLSLKLKEWNDFKKLPTIINYIYMGRCRHEGIH
jgi:hypothetical protein